MPSSPPPPADYVFDNATAHSRDQHRFLSQAHDPLTLRRLAATGVGPGWRCLEIGAGGGSVARWLAERVAPDGAVLATDIDPRHLTPGPRLTVAAHDVERDPLPESAYDLVVARLVLRHLPQRTAVLARLVRSLKPGGHLQVEEFDTSYEPPLLTPDPAAERLYLRFLEHKTAVMRAGGCDPDWGRRVPSALRDAGLVDIDVEPYIETRHAGSAGLHLLAHHTDHLRDRLLAQGMTEHELDAVRRLMADPSFLAASSVLYSVQGRRPKEERR